MTAAPARVAGFDLAPGTTIDVARRTLTQAFRAADLDSPDLDARLLVGHALRLDHAALSAQGGRTLSAAEAAAVTELAQRRLAREPAARILGVKEFWGLPFSLGPATLVPRPETETVVEAALSAIKVKTADGRAPRIADLGTGSGALLLALLSERRDALGIGTDVSLSAVLTARENAERMGLGARASFVVCDLAHALAGTFDCVVSNPPYVAAGDIAGLAPEVRDFDPRLALDGGLDGLSNYRRIAEDAGRILGTGGSLVVELGAGQEHAVTAIMAAQRLVAESPARRDLAGIARALTLRPLP